MHAKKYLLLFVALFLTSLGNVYAQYNPYWQWAKADTVNKHALSNAGSVLAAAKNGKVLWGRMTAVKRFGNNEPMGNWIITEYDSTGRQLNITLMNGNVQLFDAQADAAGNWYILGRYYDTLLFSGGQRYVRGNPAFNTDADHFMVKLNAGSMTIGWVKHIGPFVTSTSRAFTLDNNQLYVAVDSLDNTVIRAMSFATGNETFMFRQHGTSNSTSIQVDARGCFYLTGTCARDGIDFNGAAEPANGIKTYNYIVKYNNNGTHVWHYWIHDNFCLPRKLTLYQNRFLFFSGGLLDSLTIGGKHLTTPNAPDFIAARLDTNGTVIWAHQKLAKGGATVFSADAYHAVVTPDTALVMFASASGYVYWGDSVETNLQGVTAATLFSIGPDNKMRWVRPVYADYTINQHVVGEGTSVWVCGNAYTTSSSVMLDTLNLKIPDRKYIPFMAKTKMIRPIPVDPPAGIGGMEEDNVLVYPIPVRTTIQVDGLREACTLILSDMSGRAVRRFTTTAGTTRTLIDVADLPRGAYVLELRGEATRMVRKIVLQ
jgi:hypothetical protein